MIRLPSSGDVLIADTASASSASGDLHPEEVTAWPEGWLELGPHQTLSGQTIAERLRHLARLEQQGAPTTALVERLALAMALAERIEVEVDARHWTALAGAQTILRSPLMNGQHLGSALAGGEQFAFDHVRAQWLRLCRPAPHQSPQRIVLDKPIPISGGIAAVTRVPIQGRLQKAASHTDMRLAACKALGLRHRPLLALELDERGRLILTSAALPRAQPEAAQRCLSALRALLRSFNTSGGDRLHVAVERYNREAATPLQMQWAEPAISRAIDQAVLHPSPGDAPVPALVLQFSYANLADSDVIDSLIAEAGPGCAQLRAARLLAPILESKHFPPRPPGAGTLAAAYRPSVVCGGLVQLLMEVLQALERCLEEPPVSSTSDRTAASWRFLNPLDQVLTAMHPLERQALVNAVADHPALRRLVLGCFPPHQRSRLQALTAAQSPRAFEDVISPIENALRRAMMPAPGAQPARPVPLLICLDSAIPCAQLLLELPPLYAPMRPGRHSTEAHDSQDPQPSPRGGVETGLSPSATEDNFDALMDDWIEEIARPGTWIGFSAELAPRFLTDLPLWPAGRSLDIVHHPNEELLHRSGVTTSARPVVVALDLRSGHYHPMLEGQSLRAPADGDCFYHSVLVALGARDRRQLLFALGGQALVNAPSVQATLHLRIHFAAFLDQHRQDYRRRIIDLHAQLGGDSPPLNVNAADSSPPA